MLFFLANSSLMEFQVGYSTLLHLFSVLDSFTWFWMECICKIIQLILEFLKTPFIVFHFFNYTFFFICYLAASRPTLSHCQGDSLTNPMLITELMILISTQRSPRVSYEVGSQSPAMNLEEFGPGTFRFLTFLMILSIILLTVLTILPSTLSVTIWFVAVTRFDFLT